MYLLTTALLSKCVALSSLLARVKSRVAGSVRSEAPHGFNPMKNVAGGAGYLWRHAAGFLWGSTIRVAGSKFISLQATA